jgi:hypothetical protein
VRKSNTKNEDSISAIATDELNQRIGSTGGGGSEEKSQQAAAQLE